MINFTKEGAYKKLGLNLYRASGGFVAVWAWYSFAKYEAVSYRLRVRLHIKPRILWSVERCNVIDEFLRVRNLDLVHREVLEDLSAIESDMKRRNDSFAYIKPHTV
jgi:hypothetical protein